MKVTIGVIGCGWLGLPLAISLVKKGYKVHGSTTSEEKMKVLTSVGIRPFLIGLSEDHIDGPIVNFLQEMEILIVNVPPKLRNGNKENYVKKMKLLHKEISMSTINKVIFVSSTSVYGDVEGEVTEETPPCPTTESGKQLLASENIFRNDPNLKTTIVRYGGLIGPDRHPVNHLAGKRVGNGNFPVNLIHLNDAEAIIFNIVSQGFWGEVFNGVYPHHPSKRDYYMSEAKKRNLPMPEFSSNNTKEGKRITSCRLSNVKKFNFTTSIFS